MVERATLLAETSALLRQFPVVGLVGARQVGKSTLARLLAARAHTATVFDLEDPAHLARLEEPRFTLARLRGLVVLDEIQRRPDLFPVLRVLADRRPRPARFLVLGSASRDLLRQSSESLAGRIAYREVEGFDLDEVGAGRAERLWLRGGLPRSYLARTDAESLRWRREFTATFLERDVPGLGFRIPAEQLRRFWTMLAHWHGQLWNASELGRSLGVTDATVKHWLDVLAGTFVVRVLRPFHENLAKRQTKSPKVYIADSGLAHALLGIATRADLDSHPKVGASWEGFVLRQISARLGARPDELYFWRTHEGAELDLLFVRGRSRLGFEIKRTDAPRVTPSMRNALKDLSLDRLYVVHGGDSAYDLGPRIRAIPVTELRRGVSAP